MTANNSMRDERAETVRALRQKAKGERNAVGDVWGDWIIDKAAAQIEADGQRIAALEACIDLVIPDDCKSQLHEDVTNMLKLQARIAALEAQLAEARRENVMQQLATEGQLAEQPVVNAIFETADGGVTGTTAATVKRVERQDDGSLTVVIDHWPAPFAEQLSEAITADDWNLADGNF